MYSSSGENAKGVSVPEWVVILKALPPSMLTVKMSIPPKRSETNAMVRPSLDQMGWDS